MNGGSCITMYYYNNNVVRLSLCQNLLLSSVTTAVLRSSKNDAFKRAQKPLELAS
jgi:hypothetical protein